MTFLGRCEQTSVHLRTNDRPTKRPHVYRGKTTEFSGVKEPGWLEGSYVTEEPTPARVETADHSSEEPSLP